jgi:hypothetical protein
MPYLKPEVREKLDMGEAEASFPGELNYLLTSLINDYVEFNGLSYTIINDVVGALECCKQEFYRRVAVPYEEQKRYDHGDVY